MMGPSPLDRFLGRMAAGPAEMLGLGAGALTSDAASRALTRRLDELAARADFTEHEREEIRLALQVAAAQLRESSGTASPRAIPATTEDELLRDLHAVIAHSGAWNDRARHRLAALAHARGVPLADLPGVVRRLAASEDRQALPALSASAVRRPAPGQSSPAASLLAGRRGQPLWPRFIPYAILAVLALGTIYMGARIITILRFAQASLNSESLTNAPSAAPPAGITPRPAPRPDRPARAAPPPGLLAGEAPRRFAQAVALVPSGADAAARQFVEAWDAFSASWTELPPEELIASLSAFADALEAVEKAPWVDRVVTVIRDAAPPAPGPIPPARLRPFVASIGAAHVAMHKDLLRGPEPRRRIAEALAPFLRERDARALDPFTLAARQGLAYALERLRTSPSGIGLEAERRESLDVTLACARALAVQRESSSESVDAGLLAAIDALIRRGPDPTLDPFARDTLYALAQEVQWSRRHPAGGRFVAWLSDDALLPGGLSELLRAVAPLAPFTTIPRDAFLLPPGSSEVERLGLAQRAGEAWGITPARTGDLTREGWSEAVAALLAAPAPENDDERRLAEAARAAMLSAVAAALWHGNSAVATEWLRASSSRPDEALLGQLGPGSSDAELTALTGPAAQPDGRWAARYLAAISSEEARTQALQELQRSTAPLGPADADVLARAALVGQPAEVRALAQRTALQHKQSIPLLHALIESIPATPRQPEVAAFLAQFIARPLPEPGAPEWPRALARALVETMTERLAAARSPAIDRLSAIFEDAYALQAAELGATPAAARPAASASSRVAQPSGVASVRAHWRAACRERGPQWTDPESDSVERRRLARLALTQGPMQRFAVEQTAAAELMALAVAVERQSLAPRARAAAASLRRALEQAGSIEAQILTAERTILELWLIRLGLDAPPRKATP